jgi:hypothetical protein
MTTYSLTVQIDAADLPVLQSAGEQIVLVRQLADAGNTVAWIVLPLAQNHRLAWDDDYALFASATPNTVGNRIVVAASTAALAQSAYRYSTTGFQGPAPDAGLSPDMVQVTNAVPFASAPSIMLGLAQSCSVDGAAAGAPQPLNAQTVPALQIAQFTLSQNLWIYLASGLAAGAITRAPLAAVKARQVASGAILLQFDSASASRSVRYSAELGRFYASD